MGKLEHARVILGAADELKAGGQAIGREAARSTDGVAGGETPSLCVHPRHAPGD